MISIKYLFLSDLSFLVSRLNELRSKNVIVEVVEDQRQTEGSEANTKHYKNLFGWSELGHSRGVHQTCFFFSFVSNTKMT